MEIVEWLDTIGGLVHACLLRPNYHHARNAQNHPRRIHKQTPLSSSILTNLVSETIQIPQTHYAIASIHDIVIQTIDQGCMKHEWSNTVRTFANITKDRSKASALYILWDCTGIRTIDSSYVLAINDNRRSNSSGSHAFTSSTITFEHEQCKQKLIRLTWWNLTDIWHRPNNLTTLSPPHETPWLRLFAHSNNHRSSDFVKSAQRFCHYDLVDRWLTLKSIVY
jgi:hypothetical protein